MNTHEWKYRVSDPAIGRFWQVDPLAEEYVYNGVYNFSENKVIAYVELEGLEAVYSGYGKHVSPGLESSDKFKKEHPEAARNILIGAAVLPAAIWGLATAGLKGSAIFIANEVKDEALSQATGGASDIFDLTKLGTKAIKEGIGQIKKHLSSLDSDAANDVMIDRLEKIANGEIDATDIDSNYFTHELGEKNLVDEGMDQSKAHVETLKKQGIKYDKNAQNQLYTKEALEAGDDAFRKAAEN